MGACRKRRPNLACAAFSRQPINQKWAYMSKTTVQFYVHTTCRGKSSDSHVCTTSIDTDTPKTTARFDVQHISNRSNVSRVLSLTAAADAHMQSWIAFMLDQKQPFVLTCTSRRPKLAHARHTQQALASMPETRVHFRMRMLLPREIALTTCALHVCRGNGLLVGSRPNAVYVPSFEIRKRRR